MQVAVCFECPMNLLQPCKPDLKAFVSVDEGLKCLIGILLRVLRVVFTRTIFRRSDDAAQEAFAVIGDE